jgi:hypothetical protein
MNKILIGILIELNYFGVRDMGTSIILKGISGINVMRM